jgi:predicted nuclease of predicted toxin-antitoxin system
VKLLVDEGVDFPIVEHLRGCGYDVDSILEDNPGIPDREVLDRAVSDDRILVTSDKDFGDMVFRQQYAVGGVLLLRLSGTPPNEKGRIVAEVLEDKGEALADHFTVVDSEKIRMRPMDYG